MPLFVKPQNINKVWSSSGDRVAPTDQKINQGWVPEIPPHQWFNFIDNKQDQAIAHINQMGIPQWDAVTEYQANKSYVQGPTDGVIYRATQTHTNQNPEVSAGYWAVAFLTQAPDYDDTYVRLNQNLSDIPNKVQARTNLGVYSTTQVDSAIASAVANRPGIGEGQSWSNVTAQRAANTNYTNTTGRAIMVAISATPSRYTAFTTTVGGVIIARTRHEDPLTTTSINFIVPPGAVYRTTLDGIEYWSELR